MADHPSTSGGETLQTGNQAWSDHAILITAARSDGIFSSANAIRRGTFAEMIRHLATLPAEERSHYVIEKAGDREYGPDEAMKLASHPDFPAHDRG